MNQNGEGVIFSGLELLLMYPNRFAGEEGWILMRTMKVGCPLGMRDCPISVIGVGI